MPYCWALDFVTLDTFFALAVRARSKAKRMIRSQPSSVNRAVWRRPRCRVRGRSGFGRPEPAYSPSLFSRTTTQSRSWSSALRNGETTPGRNCTGRMLAHWSKFWQMSSRSPHRLMWSGTLGPAHGAEVDGVERLQCLQTVGGHHPSGLLVVLAAPRKLGPLEGDPVLGLCRQGVEHPPACGDDLVADAVGGDRGDLKVCLVTEASSC